MFTRMVAALADPYCVICGRRSCSPLCAACAESAGGFHKTPRGLPVCSLGPYGSALGERIQRLKYQEETLLAARLGAALSRVFPEPWFGASLVPVPLHPTRLAERGYNQSALIARAVGSLTAAPVDFDCLRRTKATKAQAQLSYSERVCNAQGAFSRWRAPSSNTLVLVDDVVTTGQTVDACSMALLSTNARVVGVLAGAIGGGLGDFVTRRKLSRKLPPAQRPAPAEKKTHIALTR